EATTAAATERGSTTTEVTGGRRGRVGIGAGVHQRVGRTAAQAAGVVCCIRAVVGVQEPRRGLPGGAGQAHQPRVGVLRRIEVSDRPDGALGYGVVRQLVVEDAD